MISTHERTAPKATAKRGRGAAGPPRPLVIYQTLAHAGLHRSAVALQVSQMVAWHMLSNGSTRNACTVSSYLSPRWLARQLGVERRSCITAIKRLLASGSVVAVAQSAGHASAGHPARRVRVLVHLTPVCAGTGTQHLDENGVCEWCGASLRAADDSRYPLGLVGWRSLVISTGGGDLEITPLRSQDHRGVILRSPGGDLEITPSPYGSERKGNGSTTKVSNGPPPADAVPPFRNSDLVLQPPPTRRRPPRRGATPAPARGNLDHLVIR